jgi:hypothetical protein
MTPYYQVPPPPPKNNNTLRIVLIVVGSLVALCCCAGVVGGGFLFFSYKKESGPAGDATDRFVTDLEQNDTAGAYGLLCDKVHRVISADEFAAGVSSQPRIVSHESTGVRVNTGTAGTTATVSMNLTMVNGFVNSHDFPLVKENGDWKVCGEPY